VIEGNVLAAEGRWAKPLDALRGKTARLEVRVRNAALFALEFHPH